MRVMEVGALRDVFDIGQNPGFGGSSASGAASLPVLRRSSGPLWSMARNRWLVHSERLAAMGFPTFVDLACVAGVPEDTSSLRGPAGGAGNAMHVANVGCAWALARLAAARRS